MRSVGAGKIVGFLVLCLVAGYFLSGRRSYGEVSDKTYEIATAMYAVCNRQDASKLSGVKELVKAAESDARITAAEGKILRELVLLAEVGDWAIASIETRCLMKDQVKYP